MPEPDFSNLKIELLRAGVARCYVRRTLEELGDHYQDLADAARCAGSSAQAAARQAQRQLGDPQIIAQQILAQPQLRAFAARLGPVLALLTQALETEHRYTQSSQALIKWSVAASASAMATSALLLALQLLIANA